MAGLRVVSVQVHPDGNLDLADLQAKAEKHKDKLAAFMVCAACSVVLGLYEYPV
jgi:glycine dehydrogenase